MITRVTDNIKFNMITNNLFNVSSDYGTLMEKLSTQKNINRPSDDPIGINDILDFRVVTASIEQYKTNITDSDIWLNLSEANISGLRKIADQAKAIAIEESGASGSPETRKTSAETLKALIDEALSLLNAQNGDNYIFAGSATDVQPFSNTYSAASRSTSAATTNTYAGTLTTGGTYIPTENQSYVVRFVGAGTLGTATYQISADGGETWGATATLAASGIISNIGGASVDIDLTFSAGTFAVNDTFTVNATAAGFYHGNNDDLYAVVGKNNDMIYNITGAEAFTGRFAEASVVGPGAITGDHTIELTYNESTANWSVTSSTSVVNISSQTAQALTISGAGLGSDVTVNLTGTWSQNDTITLSLTDGTTTGKKIPATFKGTGNIDLLATLNALKNALDLPEADQDQAVALITAQVDNLVKVETQMLQYETQAGAKMKSLKVTSGNHDSINLQITNMLADIENADLTKLITQFQMKQIAMQASYNMASQIGKMTIMDYI